MSEGNAAAEVIRRYIEQDLIEADDNARVGLDSPLLSVELLDSMSILELVGFLEDEFQIEVGATDISLENFETVRRIAALVESKTT